MKLMLRLCVNGTVFSFFVCVPGLRVHAKMCRLLLLLTKIILTGAVGNDLITVNEKSWNPRKKVILERRDSRPRYKRSLLIMRFMYDVETHFAF